MFLIKKKPCNEVVSELTLLWSSGESRLSCTVQPLNLRIMRWWSSSSKGWNCGWGSLKLKRWVAQWMGFPLVEIMEIFQSMQTAESPHSSSFVVQTQGEIRRNGHSSIQVLPAILPLHSVISPSRIPLSLHALLPFIATSPVVQSLHGLWKLFDVWAWHQSPCGPPGPLAALLWCNAIWVWSGL